MAEKTHKLMISKWLYDRIKQKIKDTEFKNVSCISYVLENIPLIKVKSNPRDPAKHDKKLKEKAPRYL
jgi:hypothetical protein